MYLFRPRKYPVRSRKYSVRSRKYLVTSRKYPVRSRKYLLTPRKYLATPRKYPVRSRNYLDRFGEQWLLIPVRSVYIAESTEDLTIASGWELCFSRRKFSLVKYIHYCWFSMQAVILFCEMFHVGLKSSTVNFCERLGKITWFIIIHFQ